MRRWLPIALGVTVSFAVACLIVEVWVRAAPPRPRVALVRAQHVTTFGVTREGLFVFTQAQHRAPCAERRPGVRTVSLFGSSITFGSGLERDEALSGQLEARLEGAPGGPRCVDDYAEPGYGQEQQWARAREALPSSHSDVAIWELWDPYKHYSVVGDLAFDARVRVLDATGVPRLGLLPDTVADRLFRVSQAYQYVALTLAPVVTALPTTGGLAQQICEQAFPEVIRLQGAHGGRLVLLAGAVLFHPFDEPSIDDNMGGMRVLLDCGKRLGLTVLAIAELLSDQRVEDVRADTCCHLNARGHALLAERIAPELGL
ncbi:MAG: hypothetical protein ACRENE_27060 [Polyangiaceae bacterium]